MPLKRLTIEIPADSHRQLKAEAAAKGMSLKELVETALCETGLLTTGGWAGTEGEPGLAERAKAVAEEAQKGK